MNFSFSNIAWWATLIVAVLAIPSLGLIATSIIVAKGLGNVVIFVLACWICTYLGMRLMQNPKISDKFDF